MDLREHSHLVVDGAQYEGSDGGVAGFAVQGKLLGDAVEDANGNGDACRLRLGEPDGGMAPALVRQLP